MTFLDLQENVEALPGETVTLMAELPESGLEVTWFKDKIAGVTVEDGGQYTVQGGGHAAVLLNVNG